MRRLDAEEAALWARVMATARPLAKPKPPAIPVRPEPVEGHPGPIKSAPAVSAGRASTSSARTERGVKPRATVPLTATTLDASWDKRIARGAIQPDRTIDLHGHTLHSAHAMLDAGLAQAIARQDRVILLVTGRPPRAESERPHARGAIRSAVSDWLAHSPHASHIASVRGAHPRHGGQGALYIVLRRRR